MDFTDNYSQQTDAELVKLSLENQDIFLYLMKRYEAKLLRYIKRITNIPDEDAEDLLQEVFIKVYYKLNDFDTDLKFSSWVYRITHNQVISNYRKLKARPQTIWLNPDDDLVNRISADLDIEEDVDRLFLQKNIYQLFDKLNIKYKEVLVLKFIEDKSYQEISDILKKPMGTVATLINKGKKQLLLEIEKQNINLK